LGLPLVLQRILRYNLIFKKNTFIYAKNQAVAKTLKDSSLDFKTVLNAEMKALLDKIYVRERIVSYKVSNARAH